MAGKIKQKTAMFGKQNGVLGSGDALPASSSRQPAEMLYVFAR